MLDKEAVYRCLEEQGIPYEKAEHKAVFNMAEMREVQLPHPEAEAKNLFVRDDKKRTLVVATKFSKTAQSYYSSIGRDIDIIHLNGSIEIAPILGLSDVIVDIVETGTTLRENNLNVIEEIVPISARLIANKSGFKFRTEQIERLTEGLRKEVQEA